MTDTEISLKNTKSEILDALNVALEREAAAKRVKANPVAEEKKKTEACMVESSREAVGKKVFSDELIKKFNDLETAIKIEEARLSELYGIEKELQSLTLAINAGKDASEKIEAEKSAKSADAQAALQALRDSYNQKNEELKAEYEAHAKQLKLEREREAEEFAYSQKRTRTLENNKWEDEKNRREAELAEKEQKAAAILAEAQVKADYLAELEKKAAEIPALVEKEKSNAVKAAVDTLSRDFEHKTALLEKDYTNTISRLEFQVESLTQELKKANAFSDSVQLKLDKAYSEMRELASKTVETNGSVRFIGNTAAEK